MSDDEFVDVVSDDPADKEMLVLVRHVTAKLCGIPVELLHPDHDPDAVLDIINCDLAGGWDAISFILEAERQSKLVCAADPVLHPPTRYKPAWGGYEHPPQTFGDWALRTAQELRKAAAAPANPRNDAPWPRLTFAGCALSLPMLTSYWSLFTYLLFRGILHVKAARALFAANKHLGAGLAFGCAVAAIVLVNTSASIIRRWIRTRDSQCIRGFDVTSSRHEPSGDRKL